MKKIYTKSGDHGMTRIRGGVTLPKDDPRIEANGTLDELNAQLGIVRTLLPAEHPWLTLLADIQQELLIVMSHVATPAGKLNPKPLHAADLCLRFEQTIDELLAARSAPAAFVLPGGNPLAAQLHLARTVARRAERRLCTLHREQPLSPDILSFVNRLSDLLFVMAVEADNGSAPNR